MSASASSTSRQPLRVLCLHGLTENAEIMEGKMRPMMDRLCPGDFEFVFVSAPYILPQVAKIPTVQGEMKLKANVDKTGSEQKVNEEKSEQKKRYIRACFSSSYSRALEEEDYSEQRREVKRNNPGKAEIRAKYMSKGSGDDANSDVVAKARKDIFDWQGKGRRWWTIPSEVGKNGLFIGQEGSLALISQIMREQGPFDGVFGFSTGAMMASFCQALLTGSSPMNEEPSFQPPPDQKPFQFAVYFAPWLVSMGAYLRYTLDIQANVASQTPALCFEGIKDRSVLKGSCAKFAQQIGAERFEMHSGGHSLPFWDDNPGFMADWISIAAKQCRGLLTKDEAKRQRNLLPSPYKERAQQIDARL